MNIVYAMTRHVYDWILPSMRSLAKTNPTARVFVLAEDDALPFDLPMRAEIINVTGQRYFTENGINFNTPFKYINLLKVRYPSLLPVNKVIHLDIDTIICDSLKYLWDIDLSNRWFSACLEYNNHHYHPFGDAYYNMGVAVINLEQMRNDGIERAMQDYLNTIKQPYADQDAWNKYGIEQNKVIPFDVRFNESAVTGYTDNPAIVHYCSIWDWYTRREGFRIEYLNKYRRCYENPDCNSNI